MACAQAGKSSLCGRTLRSFRPFLGASGQNVKRLEKVFRIIFLHWSLLPGKDGGNETLNVVFEILGIKRQSMLRVISKYFHPKKYKLNFHWKLEHGF